MVSLTRRTLQLPSPPSFTAAPARLEVGGPSAMSGLGDLVLSTQTACTAPAAVQLRIGSP